LLVFGVGCCKRWLGASEALVCYFGLLDAVWADTIWRDQDKLLALDSAAGDEFGDSVSISGDYAVVGAHRDDDNGSSSGSAYVFENILCLSAYFDWNCWVDFGDFVVLGAQWLQVPGEPSADISPDGGNDFVDHRDLAVMAGQWLQGVE